MTIQVNAADFKRAFAEVLPAVDKRAVIPVLTGVRVQANGAFTVSGTDLDYEIVASVPYEGAPGEFMMLSPRAIAKAVSSAGGDRVEIDLGDGLSVRCGDLALKLSSHLPADDYPSMSPHSDVASATIGEAFLSAMRRVSRAVSTEETRYYLNGVYLHHVADWTYRLVATDGHRLMMATVQLPDATGVIPPSIIPRAVVRRLMERRFGEQPIKLIAAVTMTRNSEGDLIASGGSPNRMVFAASDWTLTTKLIDGTFPNYERVVPADAPHKARFKSADLLRAVDALALNKRATALKLTLTEGGATLSLRYPEVGDAEIAVPAEHRHVGASIGLNRLYIGDMCAAAGGEEIEFAFADASAPMRVTNPYDADWLGVQMPMRV